MAVAVEAVSTLERWGPVDRGFAVSFPNGESGTLREIRLLGSRVELLVELRSAGSLVAVDGDEVEAILPRSARIVVHPAPSPDEGAGVENAGGIIRLPARNSTRLAAYPAPGA